MPNWCHNSLTVSFSKKETFEKFLKILKDSHNEAGEICLNEAFLPEKEMPIEKVGTYHRLSEYWGTKWECDVDSFEVDSNSNSVHISYQTAWSPNVPVLDKMYSFLHEEDPSTTVECFYSESGMGYRGRFHNGADEVYDMDIFYQYVIMSTQDQDAVEIKKCDNSSTISVLSNNRASILLIKEIVDAVSIDEDMENEVSYKVYRCFSETFGEDSNVVEYNGDLYFDHYLLHGEFYA